MSAYTAQGGEEWMLRVGLALAVLTVLAITLSACGGQQ